ncbi:Ribosome biogenesis protein WDR12 like [Pseudolycoriella hygida]|uniref:Ribosome biogenesis protein WDR12 like n=1 Tax=Pseudolycoriella hygida TaxID=35572 RepID=A0A9Q0NH20_9DIPT|nr:Ribosome biogenesis protein WDR12 like [Pseudolycoriella hygida]
MEIQTGEGQLQINFTTKQIQYAVSDTPYSVAANISTDELNTLVGTLLKESGSRKTVQFDFLVLGEFLRSRLGNHLKEREISFEDTIEIEYVEKCPPPEPQDCLFHDDWVASVHTMDKWILTGCYDYSINIWTTKGKHVLTVSGHSAPVKAVAWVSINDKTGVFVSASQDQSALIWEWNIEENSAKCVVACKGHERSVESANVSPSAELFATGSWDTLLKIWSAGKIDKVVKELTPFRF